ncbi:MAG: zinc ribbon domain-containing protein [Actinomycetota bacterium]|nr:zinc ribbon domain-containing protein [Actinomycetota bacterium]
MPIYEYRCAECGTQFERLQNVAGAVQPACPRCGSGQVAKLISLIGGLGATSSPGPAAGGGCGCGGACACGR